MRDKLKKEIAVDLDNTIFDDRLRENLPDDYLEKVFDRIAKIILHNELLARLDEMYALKSYSVPMYGIVMGRSSENYEWRITQLSTELTNREMK